jgi:hypothetical protein
MKRVVVIDAADWDGLVPFLAADLAGEVVRGLALPEGSKPEHVAPFLAGALKSALRRWERSLAPAEDRSK